MKYILFSGRSKFWSQTSDKMERWKSRGGKSQRGEGKKWEDQRKETVRSKKMQGREKVGKSRFTVFFFNDLWLRRVEKSNLAKAAGAEPSGQMREEKVHAAMVRSTFPSQNVQRQTILRPLLEVEMSKKCTPLWREAHFQVKMNKTNHSRTTFGSWDVEKVHAVVAPSTFPSQNEQSKSFWTTFGSWDVEKVYAVVARSTFPSQNVEKTRRSWTKSALHCGAKHLSKSKCTKTNHSQTTFGSSDVEKVYTVVARSTCPSHKCTKHTILGPLLEVQMSKKCTPLWREARFQVKVYKTHHSRTTFGRSDVE